MKNIIILLLSGIIGATAVNAYTNPLQIVDTLELGEGQQINKMYDFNNGTTCYLWRKDYGVRSNSVYAGCISCVK